MKALGIIEVRGLVASIEALDTMLKTANVRLLTCEKRLGGRLVTMVVQGSVSDVTEAVETAKERADKIGKTVSNAVIPNPHEELMRIIEISSRKIKKK